MKNDLLTANQARELSKGRRKSGINIQQEFYLKEIERVAKSLGNSCVIVDSATGYVLFPVDYQLFIDLGYDVRLPQIIDDMHYFGVISWGKVNE